MDKKINTLSQKFAIVGANKTSSFVRLTKELKLVGLNVGDNAYIETQEIDGKRRIIIEKK
ncbi:MAG: hypothetical protein ACTSPI_14245 [Candidatus Heimdallarchaeaceae archaeon]